MRAAPTLGLVIGLLVIVGASLGVGSGHAQSSSCAQDGNGASGNFTAHAGLGVHVRTLRFDGVEATIKPLRSASGLTGCERIGGLIGIGSTVAGTYLVLDLYAQARLPTEFVSHYQWAKGGPYYYVAPTRVPGFPSSAGHAHTLRITRLPTSSRWPSVQQERRAGPTPVSGRHPTVTAFHPGSGRHDWRVGEFERHESAAHDSRRRWWCRCRWRR
jgi:hypothetical protein